MTTITRSEITLFLCLCLFAGLFLYKELGNKVAPSCVSCECKDKAVVGCDCKNKNVKGCGCK